ncbi:PE-PPE domain-containing protein [Mycolicibacter heraklionensis]|uniref:PE-PPE domain-containing protein n=1 Tax=Mycolicibacter heraklionensis TaxID=512402 RepID=A0A9X7ZGA2_9MYCO|nr:PE-PPE domain-containing protein [Mycolicibacter heraklionensis]QZA06483.1 PE-PPE domain-containing protein [Mycolicibacter heraklionensis]
MFRIPGVLAVGLVGAGLLASPAPADAAVPAPQLTGADSPLGSGTALIMGGSGMPTPGQTYADMVNELYLAPLGFTGTTQIVSTPEALYPFLGPFTGTFDQSAAEGSQILELEILRQIVGGQVNAENPVVVFGWSQSAVISSLLMQRLADDDVPSDYVHFVLIGDESLPNGGMLSRFDLPAGVHTEIPSLGLTFSGPQPADLFPTTVYTHEYDGFADFPQYPLNFLSTLNAAMGIIFEHTTYLGVTPEDIANAIELPTSSDDVLTDYYMIPAGTLPLLAPLEALPYVGPPMADLLGPPLEVLVNLGYGNIEHGWSPGFADVPTGVGFLPDLDVLQRVPQALFDGVQKGITDAFNTLMDPANYVYSLPDWAEELLKTGEAIQGGESSLLSFVPTTWQDLFGTFPPHTGFPPLDMLSAVLFTLPQYNYEIFMSELADGNLLDAIGIPLAVDIGLLPLIVVGALF